MPKGHLDWKWLNIGYKTSKYTFVAGDIYFSLIRYKLLECHIYKNKNLIILVNLNKFEQKWEECPVNILTDSIYNFLTTTADCAIYRSNWTYITVL